MHTCNPEGSYVGFMKQTAGTQVLIEVSYSEFSNFHCLAKISTGSAKSNTWYSIRKYVIA